MRTAGPDRPGGSSVWRKRGLDRAADRAEDLADLTAQEDQGDDRNDRDEGEDQRVLGETLAFLVATERSNKSVKHGVGTSFPWNLPGAAEGWATLRAAPASDKSVIRPRVAFANNPSGHVRDACTLQ